MPKPPPLVEVGSPRRRKAILIHDDDDRSGGHGRHPESRPVVGHDGRRAKGDRFGGSERGREGSSSGGRAASRSPPPRHNPPAPSSPDVVRVGTRKPPEVIDLEDDEDSDYDFRAERPEKVKEEPLDDLGSDSEDSRARGRVRAAASRKSRKRKRGSPVRRAKPHRARGRGEPGSSGKQRNRKGHGAIGRRRLSYSSDEESSGAPTKVKSAGRRRRLGDIDGGRGRHDAAPARQVGAAVASRTRSRKGDRRKVASAVKYPAPAVSDGSGDDGYPDSRRGNKGGGSDWRGSAPGAVVSSRTRSRNGERRKKDVMKGKNKEDDIGDTEDRYKSVKEEEEDVVKGKNNVDDNGDSDDMYKSVEEEESGEDGNGIHDDSYAGVDEEDTSDTTEQEEGEDEEKESHEAGEDLRRTPSSNAEVGGNTRPGGNGTPPFRKKNFEGLCLVDKADTTSAGDGLRKRTRSQRRCSDKKLLTRGTFSKPYCIEVSESEPEEEVPPPGQTEKAQPSDWAVEDDSGGDDGAPAKKRRRQQQIFHSDDSDSEDGSDDSDSESDRTFPRNARKRPTSGRPKNCGTSYRQQQTAIAKDGCKDYEGCSNPRRVKNYAANAGNPADRGNLQQGDVSFKKNALFPHKGKRGKLKAEKDAYDNLFNSIFDELEKHPNGSAPAQEQLYEDRQPLLFSFGDDVKVEEEKSEHEKFLDVLWGEYDSALETVYEEDKESNRQEVPADKATLCKQAKHDLVTDDQIGIWCMKCNIVHVEIRHVISPMAKWSPERDTRADRELDMDINDILKSLGYEEECGIGSHRSGSVWDLIPGVREDMFPHQREAFEFMWNKLAGGIDIEQVENNPKTDTSGCVISHAPGTGKTRLAITFVQSYLELFPGCRPMIIAPKVMLATWEHEFRKWNVKVPFHILNSTNVNWDGDETIERKATNDDHFAQKLSINNFDEKYRRLLKLQSWNQGSSVIGLSYKLFTRLAKGEGKDGAAMRQMLVERPGLLILDEGHTPRNKKSNIWKLLVEVRTEKRIILSGTPFQNNFEELYNILCLLQGTHHGDSKLPGNDEGKVFWTSLTLNNVTDERVDEIRKRLDPFVHIYNGDILQKSLPGLRESVVILNPLPRQKKIIAMMEKSETSGNFDLEYKISLASVHPSLVTSIKTLSDEVTSILDKPSLERSQLNPCVGVKARFVYEIVRRCRSKERVLVFSQYHEPLDLIREQLSTKFNWTKDKEILHMSGKLPVETRQSLIMAFNDMNSDAKVMLATTKACGEGIQLIGASRVVLLDVVWNPSVGRQAIGRAYRIGQEKIVYTYNLIAEGTQEKSKYDRQAQKDQMSKKLFSNGTRTAECNLSPEFILSDKILEEMIEDENLKEMFVNILPSQ